MSPYTPSPSPTVGLKASVYSSSAVETGLAGTQRTPGRRRLFASGRILLRILRPGEGVSVRVHLEVGAGKLRNVIVVLELVRGAVVQVRQGTARGRRRLPARRVGPSVVWALTVGPHRFPWFLVVRPFPAILRSYGTRGLRVGPIFVLTRLFPDLAVRLLRSYGPPKVHVGPLFIGFIPLRVVLRSYGSRGLRVQPLLVVVRPFPDGHAVRQRDCPERSRLRVASLGRRASATATGTDCVRPGLGWTVDEDLPRGSAVPVTHRERGPVIRAAGTLTPSLVAAYARRNVVVAPGYRFPLRIVPVIRRESVDPVRRTRSSQRVHVEFQDLVRGKRRIDVVGRMTRSCRTSGRRQEVGPGGTVRRGGGAIAPEGSGGPVGPSGSRVVGPVPARTQQDLSDLGLARSARSRHAVVTEEGDGH